MGPRRVRITGDLYHQRVRDLACWCPIGRPCHADLLLRIANAEDSGRPEEPDPARAEPPPLS